MSFKNNNIFEYHLYLTGKKTLLKKYLIQTSGSMNNIIEKPEQHQNDSNVNASQYNQSLQGDSFFSHDQVLKYEEQQIKCEPQQWDIKPDPYLQLKQELTPGLSLKSEEPVSTLNLLSQHDQQDKTIDSTQYQEYQTDIWMASSNEYNGL